MANHFFVSLCLKTPYKRCLESDKLSDEEKQKLIKIKEELNIVELKKNVEQALNNVLKYVDLR